MHRPVVKGTRHPLGHLAEGFWHGHLIRGPASPWSSSLPGDLRITRLVLAICLVTARTVQGMARVRSGQPTGWPLVSDRIIRRGTDLADQQPSTSRALPGRLTISASGSLIRRRRRRLDLGTAQIRHSARRTSVLRRWMCGSRPPTDGRRTGRRLLYARTRSRCSCFPCHRMRVDRSSDRSGVIRYG